MARNPILLMAMAATLLAMTNVTRAQSPTDPKSEFYEDPDYYLKIVSSGIDFADITWPTIVEKRERCTDAQFRQMAKFQAIRLGFSSEEEIQAFTRGAILETNRIRPILENTGRSESPAPVTSPVKQAPVETAPVIELPPTNVISAITGNRWTPDALIVSGTLTNTSTVAVEITGIDAKGFNQDQKMVIGSSDFTIVHNNLAPGEVVNFKVALKDNAKLVKFVKVLASWSP
jgi:hypothetical protein